MTHIYWVELLDSSSDSINQQIRPLISQIIIYQVGEKKKKIIYEIYLRNKHQEF